MKVLCITTIRTENSECILLSQACVFVGIKIGNHDTLVMLENRSHLLIYLSNHKLELESYKNEADFLQKKTVILEKSKLVRSSTNRSKTLTVTTPVKQKGHR